MVVHTRFLIRYLKNKFKEKLIGRFEPQPYLAQSPDLTIIYFSFRGKLKQQVYTEDFDNDLKRFKNQIVDIIREPYLLQKLREVAMIFKQGRNYVLA